MSTPQITPKKGSNSRDPPHIYQSKASRSVITYGETAKDTLSARNQKTVPNFQKSSRSENYYQHHEHNSSSISVLGTEKEAELRGEISYCRDEVDHLKEEIKKFNNVLLRNQASSKSRLNEWAEGRPSFSGTKSPSPGIKSHSNFGGNYDPSAEKFAQERLNFSKYKNNNSSSFATGLGASSSNGGYLSSRRRKNSFKAPSSRNLDPKREVLSNFKEEVEFLRDQNSKLREALLEVQGMGYLNPIKGCISLRMNRMMGVIDTSAKKTFMTIEKQERKLGSVKKNVAYIKSMIECEVRKLKKEKIDLEERCLALAQNNEKLSQENFRLENEVSLGADSLIKSEKKINKLMREVDSLKGSIQKKRDEIVTQEGKTAIHFGLSFLHFDDFLSFFLFFIDFFSLLQPPN